MSDVRIRRFVATHSVTNAALAIQTAKVQRQLLDVELESALAPYAPKEEIVLVRRLDAALRVASRHTERHSAREWGEAIGRQVEHQLRGGSSANVLRYRHRLAATLAFAQDAVAGRDARDWAWRKLGFVTRAGCNHAERFRALLRLVEGDSGNAVALLRMLCGAPLWTGFVTRLDVDELSGLACATLRACGGSPASWRVAGAAATKVVDSVTRTDPRREVAGRPEAATVPALSTPTATFTATATATALRALLRNEPGTARRTWRARLEIVLREPRWARRGAAAIDDLLGAMQSDGDSRAPDVEPETTALAGPESDALASDVRARRSGAPETGSKRESSADTATSLASRPAQAHGAALSQAQPAGDVVELPVPEADLDQTAAGGLLLMVPLFESCGALALLEDAAVWPDASWPLAPHRFAASLLPLGAGDPAVLACCGLRPRDAVPHPHVVLTAAQTESLRRARERLQTALQARLPHWPAAALIERLGRRQARIAADPGWFEIRFSLRDVTLDIRRAALDLDPGFIPWLGIVLRYVYE